jgi:hypothetical protein
MGTSVSPCPRALDAFTWQPGDGNPGAAQTLMRACAALQSLQHAAKAAEAARPKQKQPPHQPNHHGKA